MTAGRRVVEDEIRASRSEADVRDHWGQVLEPGARTRSEPWKIRPGNDPQEGSLDPLDGGPAAHAIRKRVVEGVEVYRPSARGERLLVAVGQREHGAGGSPVDRSREDVLRELPFEPERGLGRAGWRGEGKEEQGESMSHGGDLTPSGPPVQNRRAPQRGG